MPRTLRRAERVQPLCLPETRIWPCSIRKQPWPSFSLGEAVEAAGGAAVEADLAPAVAGAELLGSAGLVLHPGGPAVDEELFAVEDLLHNGALGGPHREG